MFGVGLHFSIGDLLAVKWVAIPGAMGQIAVATLMGAFMAASWDWPLPAAILLGLALSVASTVVVLRALEEREAVDSVDGRIAVAWLVVEDLVMVLALVMLPMLAGLAGGQASSPGELAIAMAITTGKLALFLGIAVFLGPRVVPWLLSQAARTGSRELFTLAVLAIAIGIAFGAATFFGVSFALGAFCAGVVLSNSELSHRAAEESLPLQHAFAVLFFVSVGMLFNPAVLASNPMAVAGVLAIILVGKSLAAFAIVQVLGYPVGTALLVSASLAQIGEFSFILAGLGIALGIFPEVGRDLILAGALLSVSLNPLAFAVVPGLRNWLHQHQHVMARFEPAQDLRLARLRVALEAQRQKHSGVRVPPDELIGKWPVFANLDVVQRAELLSLFKPRSAVPGERLIRTGEAATEIFFISSGKCEVSVRGRRITLGPGDFFGEMALLSGAPRSADVTAIDYCQLLTLDREDFDRFISRHPDLRERIDDVAERRVEENRVMVAL
jgi:CPA2 family monovalent cation:H+ antiporter-2